MREPPSKSQIVRGVGLILALCTIWFLSVDRVAYVEKCPDCGSGRFVEQIRIFSFPIRDIVQEHHTLLERVATDLGVPCGHSKLVRERVWKRQGLCVLVGETISGTFFLSGDNSWYDEKTSARVRQMAAEDPKFVEEFRKKALLDHDLQYKHGFWKKLEELK